MSILSSVSIHNHFLIFCVLKLYTLYSREKDEDFPEKEIDLRKFLVNNFYLISIIYI